MSHANHPKDHRAAKGTSRSGQASVIAAATHFHPHDENIRLRAYELSQARNGGPGDALADWIQAEREAGAERLPNA